MTRLDSERIERQARLATEIGACMSELFAACPELCGFVVDEAQGLPLADGGAAPLCVREVALERGGDSGRYASACDEIVQRLSVLLDERPEARELLRGRTFARHLH